MGVVISPWCPGLLAAGRGWRKSALNGVSVERGKANTSAWAMLAPFRGRGAVMGQGPGLISVPPDQPSPGS